MTDEKEPDAPEQAPAQDSPRRKQFQVRHGGTVTVPATEKEVAPDGTRQP